MKSILVVSALLLVFGANAQKKDATPLNLTNVVIIGQMDDPADRYSVEINMTELFGAYNVKSKASLNLMKQGADPQILAADSMKTALKSEGFDTYVLISVRGYDKTFKVSESKDDFATAMTRGNLFTVYSEGVVSVSFEFKFFRDGVLVRDEVIKCGNAADRGKVITKLRKKIKKRLVKSWL